MREPGSPRDDYHNRHSGCAPIAIALIIAGLIWIAAISLVRWLT